MCPFRRMNQLKNWPVFIEQPRSWYNYDLQMLCIGRGEMTHEPDGEPEIVVRIRPQKFGLEKRIWEVM